MPLTNPPLWIVLVGGAGVEGRLAQMCAHDEKALANLWELVRAHDGESVVARAPFRNKRRRYRPPAIAGSRISEPLPTGVSNPSSVRTSSRPT